MIPRYSKVSSSPLNDTQINSNREGIAVIDVNADGRKDIVITNAGSPSEPIAPTDPPITILFGQENGTFTVADTSTLSPTGWINDYVFTDSNGNGYLEIIAIDHGREIAYEPSYWSQLPVYEFDPMQGKFLEYTSQTLGNTKAFYHNAANTADVNEDGLNDFIVATMSLPNVRIFLGDEDTLFRDATAAVLGNRYAQIVEWNSASYINPGAAGALDVGGDGDFDLFLLPYIDLYTDHQEYGQLFTFENGRFVSDQLFNVRNNSYLDLPASWGYSFSRIDDINGDGLQDILAFAESPSNNAGGTAIFVSMIQRTDGTFEITPTFPAEPLITDRRGELFAGNLWHDYKFSLEDLDGDNDLDLYWGQWFGGRSPYLKDGIFLNDGSGHFFRDTATGDAIGSQINWSGNSGARTYMSDLDYDGIGDFLVFDTNWSSGQAATTIHAYYSSGSSDSSSLRFGGLRSYYDIEVGADNIRVVDRLMTDGVAVMDRNSRVEFQDSGLAFDLDGNAGRAAKILGAVFGAESLSNKEYVGIGLSLLDGGMSYEALATLAMSVTGKSSSTDVTTLLWTNVIGSAPSAADIAPFKSMLDSGQLSVGGLVALAADTTQNATNINLVGLASTGIEFV